MRFTQEQFERLSQLMADKGVRHEAFELLADLRQSERAAKQEVVAITDSIVVALAGFTDFEGLPVSELNYLQVIRKLKEGVMEKSETMKRYEAETDEIATWHWHDKEFVTDDYIAWLEAQLTWRPVSEKPKDGQIVFVIIPTGWVVSQYLHGKFYIEDGFTFGDLITGVTHWLPIPPALEGE